MNGLRLVCFAALALYCAPGRLMADWDGKPMARAPELLMASDIVVVARHDESKPTLSFQSGSFVVEDIIQGTSSLAGRRCSFSISGDGYSWVRRGRSVDQDSPDRRSLTFDRTRVISFSEFSNEPDDPISKSCRVILFLKESRDGQFYMVRHGARVLLEDGTVLMPCLGETDFFRKFADAYERDWDAMLEELRLLGGVLDTDRIWLRDSPPWVETSDDPVSISRAIRIIGRPKKRRLKSNIEIEVLQ